MSGRDGGSAGIGLLRRGRELIIYDPTLLPAGGLDALGAAPGRARPLGRGGVVWIETPAGEVVHRRYRRGGWMAPLGERYLYLGAERSRPVREWRLLHALAEEGFPVPRPLAARIVRHGPWYRGELWTRAVAGRPLPEAASLPGGAGEAAAARALGRVLRRFHDAGVDHPDLHVGNVLVRDRGRSPEDYTVLDFDRGRRRRPGRWRDRRLARLARSLEKLPLAPTERVRWWRALLEGYAAGGVTDDGGA